MHHGKNRAYVDAKTGEPKAIINGKVSLLPFTSLSAAQAFVDLCDHKPPLRPPRLDPTITITLSGKPHTLTQHQFALYLQGQHRPQESQ